MTYGGVVTCVTLLPVAAALPAWASPGEALGWHQALDGGPVVLAGIVLARRGSQLS